MSKEKAAATDPAASAPPAESTDAPAPKAPWSPPPRQKTVLMWLAVALWALPSLSLVLIALCNTNWVPVMIRVEVIVYGAVALAASLLRAGAHTKPEQDRQLWDWWGKWLGVAATGVAVTFAVWAFDPSLG